MGLCISLLRSSFALVIAREPSLTGRFYEHLFTGHPEARPMFRRRPRATQERMLADALASILQHLDDPPWLAERLGTMGARHVEYGVTHEMYAWVGEALLATLAEVSGSDWSAELARAWGEAYGVIASAMQEGARRAAVRRPTSEGIAEGPTSQSIL